MTKKIGAGVNDYLFLVKKKKGKKKIVCNLINKIDNKSQCFLSVSDILCIWCKVEFEITYKVIYVEGEPGKF